MKMVKGAADEGGGEVAGGMEDMVWPGRVSRRRRICWAVAQNRGGREGAKKGIGHRDAETQRGTET